MTPLTRLVCRPVVGTVSNTRLILLTTDKWRWLQFSGGCKMAPLLSPLQSTVLKSVDCHVGDRMYFFFLFFFFHQTKLGWIAQWAGGLRERVTHLRCFFCFFFVSPDSSASSVILSLSLLSSRYKNASRSKARVNNLKWVWRRGRGVIIKPCPNPSDWQKQSRLPKTVSQSTSALLFASGWCVRPRRKELSSGGAESEAASARSGPVISSWLSFL